MCEEKIFGLGIGRTATKSLTAALEILGYNCLHWASDRTTFAEVVTGARVSRIAEQRNAIVDTILPLLHYREYAKRFPHAKFILTTRDEHSWLRSMRRHLMKMRTPDSNNHSAQLYGSLILGGWDVGQMGDQQLIRAFKEHNQVVRDFFSAMPGRFLEIDIVGGDSWGKLCAFLGKAVPNVPFPEEQKYADRPEVYNASPQSDTLAVATMILPRMEIHHLEEWIWWHYLCGVRHIWIVCDRPQVYDSALSQIGGNKWNKKPWAHFSPDKSDKQVRSRIEEIVRGCEQCMPYLNVRVLEISDFSHTLSDDIAERQVVVADKVSVMAEGLVEWMGFIDVDELLFENVIEQLRVIQETQPDVATVRMMRQHLMGNRFQNGEPIKFSDIIESWGVIPDQHYKHRGNGKSFVRPGHGKWLSPHRASSARRGADIQSIHVRFYHFHGIDATEKTLSVGWDKMYQWAKHNASQQRFNGHVAPLKRLESLRMGCGTSEGQV